MVPEVTDDGPTLSKIQYVFCTENKEVYLVTDLPSVEYCSHFHSYIIPHIHHLGDIRLLKVDELQDYHTYKLFQSFYHTLRHLHLFEVLFTVNVATGHCG